MNIIAGAAEKMEGLVVLNKENSIAVAGDKLHIQRTTRASIATPARQKLADISNLPRPTRNIIQDGKSSLMPIPPDDYINQLQKENTTLLKIVEERNILIEVTRIELKKLRMNLQKMQQQNLQLAQSYSQVLAELNSCKDRHKALQHELGCLNGILKAKNLKLEALGKLEVKNHKILHDEVDHTNCNIGKEPTAGMENGKHKNTKRRPQSKSLGSCGQVESKDKNGSKRLCKRRQSAKFEREEPSPSDDSFPTDIEMNESLQMNDSIFVSIPLNEEEIDRNAASEIDAKHDRPSVRRRSARFQPVEPKPSEDVLGIPEEKLPICLEKDTHPTSSLHIAEKEDLSITEENRRCSLNRPSRRAAKKVQTYKEIPLNVKMRRNP